MDPYLCCVANTSQDEVPDGVEWASLQHSRPGEKRVALCEMQDIYDKLLFQFPMLKLAGGLNCLE